MFDAAVYNADARRLLRAHLTDLHALTGLAIQDIPDSAPIFRRITLLCDAANGVLGECRDDATVARSITAGALAS